MTTSFSVFFINNIYSIFHYVGCLLLSDSNKYFPDMQCFRNLSCNLICKLFSKYVTCNERSTTYLWCWPCPLGMVTGAYMSMEDLFWDPGQALSCGWSGHREQPGTILGAGTQGNNSPLCVSAIPSNKLHLNCTGSIEPWFPHNVWC